MELTTFLRMAPFVMYGRDMSRPGDRLLPLSVSRQPLRPARNPRVARRAERSFAQTSGRLMTPRRPRFLETSVNLRVGTVDFDTGVFPEIVWSS